MKDSDAAIVSAFRAFRLEPSATYICA